MGYVRIATFAQLSLMRGFSSNKSTFYNGSVDVLVGITKSLHDWSDERVHALRLLQDYLSRFFAEALP
jgi:hypothetical protein